MKKRIVREIGTHAIGGLAAQAIGLALSPVVARLYAPESYAVLTVFLTVVTTCLPAICGKYEIAVVVAGTDRHARELVGLCFWLAGAISGTLLIVTLFFGEYITSWLGGPNLGWWIVAAPPFMFVSAVTVIMTNHANRHREYRALSTLALVQAVAIALMNLTFGFMGLEATGLLIGNCLATLLGSLWILAKFRNSFSLSDMRWNEAKRDVAKKYLDSLPEYEILDPLLKAYVEDFLPPAVIAERQNLPLALVRDIVSKVDRNEYKRQQAAPGLKVTSKAFGMGRRYPIAQRYRE